MAPISYNTKQGKNSKHVYNIENLKIKANLDCMALTRLFSIISSSFTPKIRWFLSIICTGFNETPPYSVTGTNFCNNFIVETGLYSWYHTDFIIQSNTSYTLK